MSKEDVDALLIRLQTLRIEEDSLIQRIIAARERETRNPRNPSVPRAPASRTTEAPNTTATLFNVGDRVRITNRVNIIGRFFRVGDDIGTIIKVTAKRVRIQTDNDLQVTRDPKNVEHLTER
jgi:hypothetical protein